ncbi:MAG: hypothetical protein QF473_40420, partial [Planctomycetota bacterium]|nr:hypothetical protein [Planctomycetota bacterium]
SGNKEVQEGDLIFIYQARPISALTHIYEVSGDPYFDPFGGWNGFWMEIAPVSEIPNFPIQEMRTDPILGNWGTVKKNFTGTVTEPVPHRIYNAILDRL